MRRPNEEIRVSSNKADRTFTIRKYVEGRIYSKYRTLKTSREEFNNREMYTNGDWKHFLKSENYNVI